MHERLADYRVNAVNRGANFLTQLSSRCGLTVACGSLANVRSAQPLALLHYLCRRAWSGRRWMRQLKSQRASATLHVEPLEIRVTPSALTSQGRTAHEGIVTNSRRFLVTRVHNDRAKGAVGIMKVNALIGDGAHKKGWLAYDDWRTAYRVVPGLYPALRAPIPSTRSDMNELLARQTRPRCGRRVV